MENFEISQRDSGFHIEGFPDAVKVIQIDSPDAVRLSDLALHKTDLEFANQCLNAINTVPDEPYVLRESLWRSAVIHFLKCFGKSNARSKLLIDDVLQGEPPEAIEAFTYFVSLRDKHLVHDDNSYSQSIPGAVLNDGSKDYKIEKIVCFSASSVTLEQANYSNLKLLIGQSLCWVIREFDQLCDKLTEALEKEAYASLMAKADLTYRVPTLEELNRNRLKNS